MRGGSLCVCKNAKRLKLENVNFSITSERMKLWDGVYSLESCTGTNEGKDIEK